MLTMLRMSGRCSINYRWLRLHLSGTEHTIEAPGASFLQDEIPICPFSFRRAKAPCPDRTRCRRRPNAIATFWKLRNGVECIGKKPLANRRSKVEASIGRYKRVIGDALKSRADDRRKAEVAIAVKALNRMRELGQAQFTRLA